MHSQWLHPCRHGTVKPSENTKYSCSFRAVPRFVLFWVHFFSCYLCLINVYSSFRVNQKCRFLLLTASSSVLFPNLEVIWTHPHFRQRSSYLCHTGTQLRPSILLVAHWYTAKTLYFGSVGWKLHSIVPGLPHLWNYAGWRKLEHVVLEGEAGFLLKYLLAIRLPSMVTL